MDRQKNFYNWITWVIRLLKGLAVTASISAEGYGQSLFPAGPESKTAGVESALHSKGPPAVLYNPGNLSFNRKSEPYAELGLINVNYGYEHPDFDPVYVSVTSPTATLGYTRGLGDKFAIGTVIFPKNSGAMEIPALPRKVGGSTMPIQLNNESLVLDYGAGLGFAAFSGLSMGVSVVRTYEAHKLRANMIGNDNALVEIDYSNTFSRIIYGARADLGPVSATFSGRPELIKEYRGTQTSASQQEESDPKVVNYEPPTYGFGVAGQIKGFRAGVEFIQHQWSKGRGIIQNGIYTDEPDADVHDTIQQSITAGFATKKGAAIDIGYANLPSPWGEGHDDGNLANHVYGVDFGSLDGIDRRVLAIGGRLPTDTFDLSLSVFHSRGAREVTGNADNVGFYSLDVTSVSGALRKTF